MFLLVNYVQLNLQNVFGEWYVCTVKVTFLFGHHLFLYRLESARLSGTSGAVYSYHLHDSLSAEIALGLSSQNQGTEILSEVLEMGCQPAVLLFFASKHNEIFPLQQCAAQAGSCKGFRHVP